MAVCMDVALPAVDWDDLFSDDLLPELAFPPPLPEQPPRPAGVSTPDQCTRSPSASFRLGSSSDALLRQQVGAPPDGTGCSAQPTTLSLYSGWSLASAALPVAPAAARALNRLVDSEKSVRTARRPAGEAPAPEAQPMRSSKRQKTNFTEEKERRRQQNLKDQRAYRARVKVSCQTVAGVGVRRIALSQSCVHLVWVLHAAGPGLGSSPSSELIPRTGDHCPRDNESALQHLIHGWLSHDNACSDRTCLLSHVRSATVLCVAQAKEEVLRASVAKLEGKVQLLQARRRRLAAQNATLKDARASLCAGPDSGPRWPDVSEVGAQQQEVRPAVHGGMAASCRPPQHRRRLREWLHFRRGRAVSHVHGGPQCVRLMLQSFFPTLVMSGARRRGSFTGAPQRALGLPLHQWSSRPGPALRVCRQRRAASTT